MFSVWASGNSIPTGDFTAYAMVKYKNVSETETIAMSFQKGISIGEQFLTGMIVPQQSNKTIESITLLLSFSANSGGMHFYNLALVEESAQTKAYINGVVSASYAYTKGALSTITRTGTASGISKTQTYSFEYDDFGNVTVQTTGEELTEDEKRLLSTYRKLSTKNRMHVSAYAQIRLEEQDGGEPSLRFK